MICQLLGAGADDDLIRRADDASGRIDIFGYLKTQDLFSLRIAFIEQQRGIFVEYS